jgi:orotidine-5'-phosphate decarboxylase
MLAKEAPVFLDAKLYDVPGTVARAAAAVEKLSVKYLSVHADEGGRAVRAAVHAAPTVEIICETVLSSIDGRDTRDMGYEHGRHELVLRKAFQAMRSGAHGVMCLTQEVKDVRQIVGPDRWVIATGIHHISDVAKAIDAGADMLIIGSLIGKSTQPSTAAYNIIQQVAMHSRG